jgi:hypothetical protein
VAGARRFSDAAARRRAAARVPRAAGRNHHRPEPLRARSSSAHGLPDGAGRFHYTPDGGAIFKGAQGVHGASSGFTGRGDAGARCLGAAPEGAADGRRRGDPARLRAAQGARRRRRPPRRPESSLHAIDATPRSARRPGSSRGPGASPSSSASCCRWC